MEPPMKKKVQIIHQLPDEIWNEILLRVPAKTVIELKIVCKNWSELINSMNFQISHLDHWRFRVSAEFKSQLVPLWKRPPALLSFESVSNDKIDIPSKLNCRPLRFDQSPRRSQHHLCDLCDPTRITVLHSEDGLLLLRKKYQLFLFNPLTKSYLFLPSPEQSTDEGIHDWIWSFVYDPSSRSYVIFYASTVNLYSLRITELNDGSGQRIRSWRQVWSPEKQTLIAETRSLFFQASISIHGKAFFLFTFGDYDETFRNTGILTIDAATEESIVTKCSGALPEKISVFFKSGRKFYGFQPFDLWVIDGVNNPTWEHHVIRKPKYKPIFFQMWYPDIKILKEGNRLIILAFKNLFTYDTSLKKWREVDIVGVNLIKKLMPFHFSLLSLTN